MPLYYGFFDFERVFFFFLGILFSPTRLFSNGYFAFSLLLLDVSGFWGGGGESHEAQRVFGRGSAKRRTSLTFEVLLGSFQ